MFFKIDWHARDKSLKMFLLSVSLTGTQKYLDIIGPSLKVFAVLFLSLITAVLKSLFNWDRLESAEPHGQQKASYKGCDACCQMDAKATCLVD